MTDGIKSPDVIEEPKVNLTETEKKQLLKLARDTIAQSFGKVDTVQLDIKNLPDIFKQEYGLFVTLHKRNNLRGCIGHIIPMNPLYLEVGNVAKLAAFEDPRFPSMSEEEVSELHIEITILSPMFRIDDPDKVIPGKHGLMIRHGYYQGLLLPQVASERGWDRQTFLDQTCLKAGLFPGAWKEPKAEIFVFTAYIFSE